jgi:hypothetical protein
MVSPDGLSREVWPLWQARALRLLFRRPHPPLEALRAELQLFG